MKSDIKITSAKQALKESLKIKSLWSHEALLLNQRTLIYVAELLEKMQPPTNKQMKRRARQWHPFLDKCLKQKYHGTTQDAIDAWSLLPCK